MKTQNHQLATLAFYASNKGWHSYQKCMTKIIARLQTMGFLEVMPEFRMARFTGKVFASGK